MSEKNTIPVGSSEISLDDDGEVDEIFVCDMLGNCLFHLERMNDSGFWMGIYCADSKAHATVNIYAKKATLYTNHEVVP